MNRSNALLSLAALFVFVGGHPKAGSAAAPRFALAAGLEATASGCQMIFVDPLDGLGVVQPGPFALVQAAHGQSGVARFHLFYTRRLGGTNAMNTDHDLSHATSSDLDEWTIVDTSVVHTRAHSLDAAHVSAPTVVKADGGWAMLYGATDAQGRESIGLARSSDLDRWEQEDRPALDTKDIPWAMRGSGASAKHRAILRDPFVMPDPDNPGGWILFFVTVPRARPDGTVVGFARSRGDLRDWTVGAPLWVTFRPSSGGEGPDADPQVAAPNAFFRAGAWRLFTTVDHAGPPIAPRTPGGALIPPDSVFVHSNATSAIDTVAARWSAPQALQSASTAGTVYNFFQDTECLEVAPGVQVLAGVSPPVVGIAYSLMADASAPAFFAADCPILPTPLLTAAVSPEPMVAPALARPLEVVFTAVPSPARSGFIVRLSLAAASSVSLAVFDVSGRCVAHVLDRAPQSAGPHEITIQTSGLARGIYFCRLNIPGAISTRKFVVLGN